MGQRIRALGERSPNSPVEAIKDIVRRRETKFKGDVRKVTKETADIIKKNIKVPKRENWEGFINSIKC